MIKKILIKMLAAIGIDMHKIKRYVYGILGKDTACNVNGTSYDKTCLFIYIVTPFQKENLSDTHQNIWQAKEWARIIGTYGYNVDVINYINPYVRLKQKYDMIIGLIPRDIDLYKKYIKKDGILISYLTSSNISFSNEQEYERLADVYQRRGVRLRAQRQSGNIQKDIENFDAAFMIGNAYNLQSYYREFNMPPSFLIKNTGYEFCIKNRMEHVDTRNFLYFASAGQVYKGLDLLLEIFAEPSFPCELYVCSSYESEKDFCKEYDTELFHTQNIHAEGFVNIHSERFKEIVEKCAYVIVPSCAEGQMGSALTVMSAGLIPILSRESGYDDDEVIILPDCKMDTIRKVVLEYSQKDKQWIKERSEYEIQIVKERYSRECFIQSVQNAFEAVLGERK